MKAVLIGPGDARRNYDVATPDDEIEVAERRLPYCRFALNVYAKVADSEPLTYKYVYTRIEPLEMTR